MTHITTTIVHPSFIDHHYHTLLYDRLFIVIVVIAYHYYYYYLYTNNTHDGSTGTNMYSNNSIL